MPELTTNADELRADERALIASTWAYRAAAERYSEKRFARLATELAQVGAIEPVVTMARTAVTDEERHARICQGIADEYGGSKRPTILDDRPCGPPELEHRDRVLYEIVAFCCITETINAAMLTAILGSCKDPRISEAVRAVLRDEVQHSRLGWAHLEAETRIGRGAYLPAHFVAMLEAAGATEIFGHRCSDPARDSLGEYGELSSPQRQGIFVSALTDLVLPGFERVQLETGPARAWLAGKNREPTSQSNEDNEQPGLGPATEPVDR